MTYLCAKLSQMRKTYEVAGHKFALVMPDDSPAWNKTHNYDPFVTDDANDCDFIVEGKDEWYDTSDKKYLAYSASKKDKMRIDFYEWKEMLLLEIAPTFDAPANLCMLVNKDHTLAEFHEYEATVYSFNIVLMLMYAASIARKDTLLIHASVTMKDGKGYLFLGSSGTGKSTHSQLWISNIEGCSLLNDDNPVVRIESDGEIRVYGSPWSGKTPCYRNLNVPVGAFVSLRQAKQNAIKRLSAVEAYTIVHTSLTGFRFVKELADDYHNMNSRLIGSVPFYGLDCLPDADAAFLCYKTVTQQ